MRCQGSLAVTAQTSRLSLLAPLPGQTLSDPFQAGRHVVKLTKGTVRGSPSSLFMLAVASVSGQHQEVAGHGSHGRSQLEGFGAQGQVQALSLRRLWLDASV
ncbi:hypothetical protein NDU88_002989 [Pleurodeles waltl]|uniref:Uncharacterized protein n=1 Tax=Pleurodeles waltl TaxID=8319 RepID=A0AAV7KW95_PLEWA|nr:hypothetical protein NDU88_002989 [Pleurodeles waltl]